MTWVSKCSYISHVLQKSVNTFVNNNELWIRCSCANSNSQWFQTENFETCWLSRHSGKSPQSRCSNLKQFQDQRYEYRCIVKYKFGKVFVKNENPQDSVNPFFHLLNYSSMRCFKGICQMAAQLALACGDRRLEAAGSTRCDTRTRQSASVAQHSCSPLELLRKPCK